MRASATRCTASSYAPESSINAVGAESISPYRYTPQQVLAAADLPADVVDEELRRLVTLLASNDGLNECLQRIHYAELSSPYPLVSQRVLAFDVR